MRIAESMIRQIVRKNDEGLPGFGGKGDYSSWEDIYDALKMRMDHETGPKEKWRKTGYRPEPGAQRGPTHMMQGSYIDLFSFISDYLFDFIGPNAPFGRYYRGPEPGKELRARVSDHDTLNNMMIRFMREFESKFPGAADQHKIDDRRIGGPGPNRTQMYELSIPIPYFEDFKKVIVTWLTNTLTGEDREIPWPEDMRITEGRIRQIVSRIYRSNKEFHMRITESRIRQIIREETSKILEIHGPTRHYPDVADVVEHIISHAERLPGISFDELSDEFGRGRHYDEMDQTISFMEEKGLIEFNKENGMLFLTPKSMMFINGWTGPKVDDPD